MELHFKYLGAMQVADKKIEGEKHVRTPAHFLTIPDTHSIWSVVCPLYIGQVGQKCACSHGPPKATRAEPKTAVVCMRISYFHCCFAQMPDKLQERRSF